MSAPARDQADIHDLNVAYARRLLDDEKRRQHLIAEQNERAKKGADLQPWQIESYARQERDARTGERILGEILRALPGGLDGGR